MTDEEGLSPDGGVYIPPEYTEDVLALLRGSKDFILIGKGAETEEDEDEDEPG